jgi:hypothetical protein
MKDGMIINFSVWNFHLAASADSTLIYLLSASIACRHTNLEHLLRRIP